MEQFSRDVRIAIRSLLKQPGTTALAAVALALGIGLTTAMFCIVDGVFLRGLPFEGAGRLLYVGEQNAKLADRRPRDIPMNDYLEWRAAQRSFEGLAAFSEEGADVAGEGITPQHYQAARVSAGLFALLRVAPVLGRALTDADAADGAPPVAVISDTAWRRQFDADPAIVGRVVRVDRVQTTIVGVMPAGFGFPHDEDVWRPLAERQTPARTERGSVNVMGRLRAGVDAKAADAEVAALTARIAEREAVSNLTAVAMPYLDRFMDRQITGALTMMLGAVFGVLLIACVNVTNLLLARAADRVREVGIRLAMGASRVRVIRQFLIEGALLASAGGAAGIGIAFAGVRFFNLTMADSTPPFWVDVRVDARVLAFTAALAAAAALGSSLAPALRATRLGIFGVLKDAGRSTAGFRMVRFSRALVVAEVMLSFTLLIVSGLLIKSVIAVTRIEIPFRTDLLHARLTLPAKPYPDPASIAAATDRLLELVAAEPGVNGVAVTTAMPDNAGSEPVLADDAPPEPDVDRRPRSRRLAVSASFFQVTAIKPMQGRVFDGRDRASQPPVAIVTVDLAERLFHTADVRGRRIQVGPDPASPWRTIVGVVPRLTFANTASTRTRDAVIVPIAQAPSRWMALLVSGDEAARGDAARRAMARLDPDLPLSQVATLAARYRDENWPVRLFGSLFASFGLAALLLSASGLYGVMAFRVRSRTQEIGVRMALGANPAGIVWMVLRQGAVLLLVGMALGFGIGGWLGQQLQLFLFGVKPWDPGVFALITVVLAGAGLLATLIPARRAASIDPMVALREQ